MATAAERMRASRARQRERAQATKEHWSSNPRAGWLIAQALHEAAKALEAKPKHLHSASNIAEMRELLETHFGGYAAHFRMQDEIAERLIGANTDAERVAILEEVNARWNESLGAAPGADLTASR